MKSIKQRTSKIDFLKIFKTTVKEKLENQGLSIHTFNRANFQKEIIALGGDTTQAETLDAIYHQVYDKIYKQNHIIHDKNWTDKIFIHEMVHAIRSKFRMNKFDKLMKMHKTMKDGVLSGLDSYFHNNIIAKAAVNRGRRDLTNWREEAVADLIPLFLAKKSNKIIKKDKFTLLCFCYIDIFSEKDIKIFCNVVKKECLETLDYIFDNYIPNIKDKDILKSEFNTFMVEEIERNIALKESQAERNELIMRNA